MALLKQGLIAADLKQYGTPLYELETVLSTEPVIPVTTKESKTVEKITLIARELRTRE